MSEAKIHAAVPNRTRGKLVALCRHISHPRLTDDRREVTCEACRVKLEQRPRRRLRRHRV